MITIRPARNAGVPLVEIQTADAQQTIDSVVRELNGVAKEVAVMRWDIIRGLVGLTQAGKAAVNEITPNPELDTQNPTECLSKIIKAPERSIIFFLNAHLFWGNESVKQGIWNLRDEFKLKGAMLVMCVPLGTVIPEELKSDVISQQDTLPTEAELITIVNALLDDGSKQKGAMWKPEDIDKSRVVDALLGLSAFAAEQALAISMSKEGVDLEQLWETKRTMIEQTPGLQVWRGKEKREDIGGNDNVLEYGDDLCEGDDRPRAILFIDEIEKSAAGFNSDSSGVSQDQNRCLLTWMQDRKAAGLLFLGPPGSGKSVVAKAMGNRAGILTIALDLGGMKGSLVGQSEARLRGALSIVDAVSQGKVLVIATCNSVGSLPPELRRRFTMGTFFFPLPNRKSRKRIWDIYMNKFNLPEQPMPDDTGWTGAEIETCCTIASRLKRTLVRAAKSFVPVSVSAKETIEKLCRESSNRYISAEVEGLYQYEAETNQGEVDRASRRALGNG